MKRKILLIILMTIFLIGCGDVSIDNNEAGDDNFSNDVDVTDSDIEELQEVDSEEPDNVSEQPDYDDCGPHLLSDWMEPEDDWKSWSYLKMIGVISDYYGEYEPAVYVNGKINLDSGSTDLTEGSYLNYQSQVLIAQASTYEYRTIDSLKGVIDSWEAMWQFSQQLVPVMKEEGLCEAGFGGMMFFRHMHTDIELDSVGNVSSQQIRKSCYIAISETDELEEEGEIYDVPVGDIFICIYNNIDGSVGEKLYMMFKNEMTEDKGRILEYFNTRSDDTVAVYGDEDFTPLCQCYDEEGNEVNCWQYDGPGGPEECPDYVPQEHCNPAGNDNDEVSDNNVDEENDEDVQ